MGHRREQHVGADGQAGDTIGRQQLRRDVALVVDHHHERVVALAVEHRIGTERAFGADAGGTRRGDRGSDDSDLLVAEHAVLAGVRIEARDREARRRDAEAA